MDEFEEGTCDWFDTNGQGYGFINRDSGGAVYVHYKQITRVNLRDKKYREIRKGDRVKYKVVAGYRMDGTQAAEVEIIAYGTSVD